MVVDEMKLYEVIGQCCLEDALFGDACTLSLRLMRLPSYSQTADGGELHEADDLDSRKADIPQPYPARSPT